MNLQELIKQKNKLVEQGIAAVEAGDLEAAEARRVEAEALDIQITKARDLLALGEKHGDYQPLRPPLPGGGEGPRPAGGDGGDGRDDDGFDPLTKAVYVIRFGSGVEDDPTSLVLREIYGGDYRQKFFEQEKAFVRYLRTGVPDAVLRRQYWTPADVRGMLKFGLGVREIKTTMVEGQDTLGGYAVPPQRAAEIITRLPGLTAVRGGGAMVVQTSSNAIEWLKLTGGGDQYPTGLRGAWGTEVQDPTEKNLTLGLENIVVHTYTYKFSMSQSLVEDAANLVDMFMEEVVVTLAVDEDSTFLTGDGAGKPRGILPSSTNTDSLTEVVSANASALTWTGLKNLRRGIASQYRLMNRASWIGNGDTGGDIEGMTDGIGRDYVDALVAGEEFPKLRGVWRESEAMPDVAANAYPLIFGDLSGYKIVERLGLSVVRFQDSATGINKVEYHIRRRIGGRLMEPWKIAVQKVAAS